MKTTVKQKSFFEEDDRLKRLTELGDQLVNISATIDFGMFRPLLDSAIVRKNSDLGGRPPWDNVLMFKVLLLQQWYNLADDKTEYVINDRLSFQRFLNLSLGDKVPDSKTIWLFREILMKSGKYETLFSMFEKEMEKRAIITRKGSIVDAAFVEVPKQRNTREENKKIKQGEGDQLFGDNKHKKRQKDVDARWTKKNNKTFYGYKDHIKVDKDSKMIVSYSATDASVHDSKELVNLLDEKDESLNADSAYVGEELHATIKEKYPNIKLNVNEKANRNKPLTEKQKESNRIKSKTRARGEHVFGHMTNSFGDRMIRTIGEARAKIQICLKNLAYNFCRYTFLCRVGKVKNPIPTKGYALAA